MDPGTTLAVVSLALQVTNGLLSYYELWAHAEEDIAEIQRSLLSLVNIFAQLDVTLKTPNLEENIVAIIRLTMKSCEDTIQNLQVRLTRAALISVDVLLKPINFATLKKRYQNADILLYSLASGIRYDSEDFKGIPSKRILKSAIFFDSTVLMVYILQNIPKNALQQININQLLLRAVVEDKIYAAAGIVNHYLVIIHEGSRRFMAEWISLMGKQEFRNYLLAVSAPLWRIMKTQLHPESKAAKILSTLMHKPSYERLEITLETLWERFESLPASNLKVDGLSWKGLTHQKQPLNANQNLILFSFLKGPHSALIQYFFSSQLGYPMTVTEKTYEALAEMERILKKRENEIARLTKRALQLDEIWQSFRVLPRVGVPGAI